MKLRCSLVSRKLNNLASSEALPESVMRHIEQCEECRREASAYTKLGSLLRECGADESGTELTWDKLRSALSDRPEKTHKHKVTLVPAYTWAAVMIVVVLAASVFWINRRPEADQVPVRNHQAAVKQEKPVKQEQPAVAIVKTQEKPVHKNKTNHQVATASQVEEPAHRDVPSTHKRDPVKYVPAQKKDKRYPTPKLAAKPEEKATPAAPVIMADNADTDTPTGDVEIAVVGAEEHVIDVVGVNDYETNKHEYVIQQVGYSPDQAYTRL